MRLDRDTPLLPRLVAEGVCAEAAAWLDDDCPMALAPVLAARATRLYKHNPAFARRLRVSGNEGREWLRAFLRHWLATRLHRQHPALYERLPSAFCLGEALTSPTRHLQSRKARMAQPPGILPH